MKIDSIHARQILDSRGNPTVEADIILNDGSFGRAAVPSGASTGTFEALELRDSEEKIFLGRGVKQAIQNILDLESGIKSKKFNTQTEFDNFLIETDGTENKSKLGANATLALSLSFAKATASSLGLMFFEYIAEISKNDSKMPSPMFNIINGGRHANWSTDIQEYMIIVEKEGYSEKLRVAVEIYMHLRDLFLKRGLDIDVGNEGGFAPGFKTNLEPLGLISEAIESAGYKLGEEVFFAFDIAASEFFDKESKLYSLKTEGESFNSSEWSEYLKNLVSKYPIKSIEDPFSENDWESWGRFTSELGENLQIVGDDLLVTNSKRIKYAIDQKACNSLLAKPNQVGTLTETLQAMKTSKEASWRNIVSHRSGETEDTSIAHIAVGTGCGQIKTGAPSRGERTAKYNELLRIEELLAAS